jgi:hypothetical protein
VGAGSQQYLYLMKKWFLFSLLLLAVLLPEVGEAQCAMCKAVAETDADQGGSAAAGLNEGIAYLMAFPYLILGAVSYAIYRHKKR